MPVTRSNAPGARKHIKAEERKAALKTQYFAKLKGCPSSPRKMRYVVDMIRGMEVNRALGVLRFSKKAAAADVEKLLRSAINNWEQKNDRKAEAGELFITRVFVATVWVSLEVGIQIGSEARTSEITW